jgi:hypothetical protein
MEQVDDAIFQKEKGREQMKNEYIQLTVNGSIVMNRWIRSGPVC